MIPLRVEGLGVSLGSVPILADISFSLEAGQTTALLGDNGSGKSTLIRASLGLTRHQTGRISLLGVDLADFTAWDQIGYVPQRAAVSLHSTTVGEVVSSGLLAKRAVGWLTKADRTAVERALDLVGLPDQRDELYLHLSGGQQQRVLIARGIVNQPRLMLLDEPFAGVDLASQAAIAHTLTDFEATILIVLHEIGDMADQIGRCLILRQGRLVYDGPPTDLARAGSHELALPERARLMSGMEPRWIS